MILGIDSGATTTDFALLENKKISRIFSTGGMEPADAKKLLAVLKKHRVDMKKIKKIAVTGGKSKKLHNKKLAGIKIRHIDEITAIGAGGSFLSGKKNCVVVSCGTGTCIVSVKNSKAKHFGGIGIGGGTLSGLSQLLLGISDTTKIEKLARKGNRGNVDLTVRNIIGSGIGIIPAGATASNFAKFANIPNPTGANTTNHAKGAKPKKNDTALALTGMVGEVIAVTAVFAAKALNQKTVVFTGRAILPKSLRSVVAKTMAYYGYKPVIPIMHEAATAAGAALMLQKKNSVDS